MNIGLRMILMTAIAAGVVSTSLAAIEPGLVCPTLTPDEAVVADLVVTDKPYHADPAGQKDNTTIVQRVYSRFDRAWACVCRSDV